MKVSSRVLSECYKKSHSLMRDVDGLQPQEAFDELLKYLFLKESADENNYHFPPFYPPILGQDLVSLNRGLVKKLRTMFRHYLKDTNSWSSELWLDKSFNLSDSALIGIHGIFETIDFCDVDIDTRSAALNEFIPSDLRKGLGIFPTPDGIARMMVEIASPRVSSCVLDPACGTGTFLVETLKRLRKSRSTCDQFCVWGIDRSSRMLLLSELNLGHSKNIQFLRSLADSLYQSPSDLFKNPEDGFDIILTNPPFGVIINRDLNNMTTFQTCRDQGGRIVKRQQSEVVFLEQCLKYLKPGGLLGIVLPRSVITNSSLRPAREAVNSLGFLESVISLPPETFCASGTQTNTVILFVRRFKSNKEKSESVAVVSVDIDNVGFDSTGRIRHGNQLQDIAKIIKMARKGRINSECVHILPDVSKDSSISLLPDLLAGRVGSANHINRIPLSEIVEFCHNGRTPGRINYSSTGLFLVKVGNLTGKGINWEARDRNFISGPEECKRKKNYRLMLRKGDILLTSSAHSPVYIAKKVDIVCTIPKWIGGRASFVGEVMMLRLKKGFDPYMLLAYLRLPSTQKQIQAMVRGQTAHLNPKDFLQMLIPKSLLDPPELLQELANHIKEESRLSEKMNDLSYEQREVFIAVQNSISA